MQLGWRHAFSALKVAMQLRMVHTNVQNAMKAITQTCLNQPLARFATPVVRHLKEARSASTARQESSETAQVFVLGALRTHSLIKKGRKCPAIHARTGKQACLDQ
jgi:hypothetical protein